MQKQVFKPYLQNQIMLLPPNLEDLIPENHMVRFINNAINEIDAKILYEEYQGGGTSAYNPVMMLKVLIYAYISHIYSSRRIAKALREDINFMWLSGMNRPDFRTINIFRGERLKDKIDDIFTILLVKMVEAGYVKFEDYFVDGTKIEADANKYSYVWRKNTERYKSAVEERIKDLLSYIESMNKKENEKYGDKDLEEVGADKNINSRELKEKIHEFKELAEENEKSKKKLNKEEKQQIRKVKSAINKLENKELEKLEKYEKQEEILAGRNSYSKTDEDATFHRMKDDTLRASYNVMMGTEGQYIVNYSIHQNAGESGLFIPHMNKLYTNFGMLPENIMGDSAFGSLENYEYIEEHDKNNFLKFNTFHKEDSKKFKENPYLRDNFIYNRINDYFLCPNNKKLNFKQTKEIISKNGFKSEVRIYECEDCRTCKFAELCKKTKNNRTIQINCKLERHKDMARKNLKSKKGIKLRKQRSVDVEAVFGDIKQNAGYWRFRLRGLEKTNLEYGLLSIAHNFKKQFKHRNELKPVKTAIMAQNAVNISKNAGIFCLNFKIAA